MKRLLLVIIVNVLYGLNIHAQLLLPKFQRMGKDSTYVKDGYTYQCDLMEGAKMIYLYNADNQWTYANNVYKSTGETYFYDGTERTNNIVDNQEMVDLAYSIVNNAFTREMANEFGTEKLQIAMYLDAVTGKVVEVGFQFTTFNPYARVPISYYRDIELKLKEQISLVTTDVGKQLNYIMLSWRQRPRGALPPPDTDLVPIE
ncbi:MAG: DUF5043 domain-containing protein [Bacteroides sp.]|nr:DUF5043 domain-containing protein [Bacteroides sp.]